MNFSTLRHCFFSSFIFSLTFGAQERTTKYLLHSSLWTLGFLFFFFSKRNDPPYKIYVASHVEVSSANAVPGGFAQAPFHDPASALYPPPLPRGPMGTTHPPIIHTSGHLVPPPRRSARGQAGLLFLLLHMGVFFPSPRDDKNGGNSKVFKRVASKCLTSMYAFTCRFPKSTVGGFFVFIDRYLCIRALRGLD